MSLHKDLLQLVFLELDHGLDMLDFSELSHRCYQIFQQQIKIINKPETEYNYAMKYMENNCFHGQLHGISREWHKNGQLVHEHNYYQDQKHGVCRGWYYNGTFRYEHNYAQGRKHGICRRWNINGQSWFKTNYHYGTKIGKLRFKTNYHYGTKIEK